MHNYLSQLVISPTRGEQHFGSNSPNYVSAVQVIDNLPGTDHDAIQFTLSVVVFM